MGMSMDDFERCTPSEFSEAYRMWQQNQEVVSRRSWEQSRFLVYKLLIPLCKNPIEPKDVARFPWDEEMQSQAKETEKSTKERMERMKKKISRLSRITETSIKTNGTPDNSDGAQ